MSKQALLIFTKNAEAGKVKTRLAATIGNEAALEVFEQLQRYTVSVTQALPLDKFVFYADYIGNDDVWSHDSFNKKVQQGDDLGERMKNAFDVVFAEGYEEVVIIGTDCPGLNAAIITNAFAFLQGNDIVIGPAEDGGYYPLAMKKLNGALFDGVQWSTGTVLDDTIQKCASANLQYALLPVLRDIDKEEDLLALKWQEQ